MSISGKSNNQYDAAGGGGDAVRQQIAPLHFNGIVYSTQIQNTRIIRLNVALVMARMVFVCLYVTLLYTA